MRKLFIIVVVLIGSSACFANNVLVILSSEEELQLANNKTYYTGFFLNEMAVPTKALSDKGFSIIYATPKGNAPVMEKASDHEKFFENEKEYLEHRNFVEKTGFLDRNNEKVKSFDLLLKEGLDEYVAIFTPGGHAPMIDLVRDEKLGRILKHFHDNKKPTAMVCHGPVSLISTMDDPQAFINAVINRDFKKAQSLSRNWPYKGYSMTVYSTLEEIFSEKYKLKGPIEFYPQLGLDFAGGNLIVKKKFQSNFVQDRELLTGQNPYSDKEFTQALLKMLESNY
ncbi:MAG: type 1 glutamine amidotransferase domain-containing protein [Candidatus Caenarcaniphilales bacterium]|nr:type 1 glutamine amidotransferase domain-containing protein [Candidatus Caenarcaniphilales bacterium]